MRVLHRSTAAGHCADIVLGVGLVGEAVVHALRVLPGSTVCAELELRTDWRETAIDSSLEAAVVSVETFAAPIAKVRVFWCAGRAGFSSTVDQCAMESAAFQRVVSWAERLRGSREIEFHLTSSAGGLHEGELLVTERSELRTHRPYCALKLSQEEALEAAALGGRFVYRLSSVYGIPAMGRRLGLISALAVNALRQQPTLITAHASTLRDFVSTEDVARFMALEHKGCAPSRENAYYLVSGRPLTVWSLQLAVERHLHRRVSVVYTTGKHNFESTTFLPSMRPRLWEAASVESNLSRIIGAAQLFAPPPKTPQ